MALVLDKTIAASPGRVFAVLSDLGQARQWMPAIQKVENVSPGPFGLGTSWRETRQAGKRVFESTIRITGYEPAKVLAFIVEGKGMTGQMRFTLAPAGAGTQVRYEAQMKGRGLMSLMSGTINRMMAETDKDLLDRLQAQVERR
ncbi:MAG: hypothetical protein E6K18_06520 [Methanobacteriota archaeon]|nr:MAG: hypothetical protein E6K18_06520 [Euryarchaeota archaeon]